MGTGSIWSTVGDLATWDRALAAGELLSGAAMEAMFTVHVPLDDDDDLVRSEGYGYGWFISSVRGAGRLFYHTGDNPGFRSVNGWCPDDDVRLAVLSNEGADDLGPALHDLVLTAFPASAST
jgi:CubicO group peptidase (beta-lactamase class C family)